MFKSYKNLKMWVLADKLAKKVYKSTDSYPRSEIYGLTSQVRRAAVSVVLNIVEGYARRTDGDFRRFLVISLGSLSEVEYLLELSLELGYLTESDYNNLEKLRAECGRLLWSYRQKIK